MIRLVDIYDCLVYEMCSAYVHYQLASKAVMHYPQGQPSDVRKKVLYSNGNDVSSRTARLTNRIGPKAFQIKIWRYLFVQNISSKVVVYMIIVKG